MMGHLNMTKTTQRKSERGLSLVETTIVLVVIGIIIGGVWRISSIAWEQTKREQAVEAITAIVNNARAYYAGQPGVQNWGNRDLTSWWIANNIIPSQFQRPAALSLATCRNKNNLCADSPWGPQQSGKVSDIGTIRVCDWHMGLSTACGTAPTAGRGTVVPFFAVIMAGFTQGGCIALVESITGSKGPSGLVAVNINDINVSTQGPIQPVSDAIAIADCSAWPDGAGVVRFVYRIDASGF